MNKNKILFLVLAALQGTIVPALLRVLFHLESVHGEWSSNLESYIDAYMGIVVFLLAQWIVLLFLAVSGKSSGFYSALAPMSGAGISVPFVFYSSNPSSIITSILLVLFILLCGFPAWLNLQYTRITSSRIVGYLSLCFFMSIGTFYALFGIN
jgi:hypothetical protein